MKRRELLSGKPYEKDALGPEGMPLCYGAAECAKALLEHLRPDLDALGKCLAMVPPLSIPPSRLRAGA